MSDPTAVDEAGASGSGFPDRIWVSRSCGAAVW